MDDGISILPLRTTYDHVILAMFACGSWDVLRVGLEEDIGASIPVAEL
jgi:hypothetical protein